MTLTSPRLWIEQTAGLVALGAAAWWWLGLAESSALWLVISAVTGLLIITGFVCLALRARRALARPGPGWSPAPMLVGLLALAGAVWIGWKLIWWVPEVGGFFPQASSMAVRFAVAYALVLAAWLNLLRLLPPARMVKAPA